MTIEIQRPELEALILERMQSGMFESVEDILIEALKSSPLSTKNKAAFLRDTSSPTGADLIAAMQASPYKEICLEPSRDRLPIRDVAF